jgi:hypothetical protein
MLLVLPGCLAALTPASAQGLVGKFTLPYQVRWGNTFLHEGTYNYSVEPLGLRSITTIQASPEPVLVTVRGERGGPATLLLAMASQCVEESDGNGLTFLLENGKRTLRSLSVNNFGIVVRFKTPKSVGETSANKAQQAADGDIGDGQPLIR